jgi:MYXO-CTERM domain-containing protein
VYRNMKIDRTGRNLVAGAYGRGAFTFDFGSAAVTPPTTIPKLPRTQPPLATTGSKVVWPVFGALLVAAALLALRRRRPASR